MLQSPWNLVLSRIETAAECAPRHEHDDDVMLMTRSPVMILSFSLPILLLTQMLKFFFLQVVLTQEKTESPITTKII